MSKTKYYSRIDWWVWQVFIFTTGIVAAVALDSTWWVLLSLTGSMLFCVTLIAECWYEIGGETLVVYQFFCLNRFPISKVAEIKKTPVFLATVVTSRRHVSIKLIDRSVMKSAMSLEITPKNRDRFITQFKEINSQINVKS